LLCDLLAYIRADHRRWPKWLISQERSNIRWAALVDRLAGEDAGCAYTEQIALEDSG
jgi:hypothetical protein